MMIDKRRTSNSKVQIAAGKSLKSEGKARPDPLGYDRGLINQSFHQHLL